MHLNGTVLVFALVVSALTGIIFGIMPALRSSDVDLRQDLTETAGRGGTSRRQHRTLNAFIAAEIAISVVLLVGAGLVIRAFAAVISTDPGFRAERLMTFHLSAPAGQFTDSTRYTNFFGPVIEASARDSRREISLDDDAVADSELRNERQLRDRRPAEGDGSSAAAIRGVSGGRPGLLPTMGIPIKAGRGITDADAADREPVVVVNEAFAKKYFPDSPIGHQLDAVERQARDHRRRRRRDSAGDTGARARARDLRPRRAAAISARQYDFRYFDASRTDGDRRVVRPGDPRDRAEPTAVAGADDGGGHLRLAAGAQADADVARGVRGAGDGAVRRRASMA